MISSSSHDQSTDTAAYVPFLSRAMRKVLPYISSDVWDFFCFAVAHRDAMNLLFPGTRAFMAGGWSANQVEPLYEQCIVYGLLRLVQERGRDGYGRWMPALYQANPALVYIDPRRAQAAMQISSVNEFCPLIGLSPDLDLSVKQDQVNPNQDQVNRNLRGNPDLDLSVNQDQVPYKQNQKAELERRTRKKNQEEEPDKQIQKNQKAPLLMNFQPGDALAESDPEQLKLQKQVSTTTKTTTKKPQGEKPDSRNTSATRALTPLSAPPLPRAEKIPLKMVTDPLAPADERTAQLFVSVSKETKIGYARMYVKNYGSDAVMSAMVRWSEMTEDAKNKVGSAVGIMVHWIKTAAQAGQAGRDESPGAAYDIGNITDCHAALNDPDIDESEREVFRKAIKMAGDKNEWWYAQEEVS